MKYYLLSVGKNRTSLNIGDYIQALASAQYYPSVDGFLDRDEQLKDYNGDLCKMIMNGWYMLNPMNWPPSDKIVPLFVAFHLNVRVKKELTNVESISYLKKHEPIGCRDLGTMNLLKSYGIDAYFSGCMTLTLGKKYHNDNKDEKTYIVDPLLGGNMGIKEVTKALIIMIKNAKDVARLIRNSGLQVHRGRNKLKNMLKIALYYKEYSKVFSREIVMNSIYVCHQSKYYKKHFKTDKDRLAEAERIIKEYAKAKLVITSRLHCALPCLGLETPVILLTQKNDVESSSCRFGGLRNLFNIIEEDNGVLYPRFPVDLFMSNPPQNKDYWRNLAKALDKRCSDFFSNNT